MAEQLESFDFSRETGRHGSKYDRYMDGGVYRLVIGEDVPSGNPDTVLRTVAARRGLKLRTSREPGAIVVQAYTPTEAAA